MYCCQIPLPTRPPWYLLFDVRDEESLREVAVAVLRLYARPKAHAARLEERCAQLKREALTRAAKDKSSTMAAGAGDAAVGGAPSTSPRTFYVHYALHK